MHLFGSDFDTFSLRDRARPPGTELDWNGIIRRLYLNPARSSYLTPSSRLSEMLHKKTKKGKKEAAAAWGPPVPASHVKMLEIDDRFKRAREDSLNMTMGLLLQGLPEIRTLMYDGPLSVLSFSSITNPQFLRRLMIRFTKEIAKRPDGEYPPGSFWVDPTLNFKFLSSLPNLEVLVVGRLRLGEARSLAEILPTLKLKYFQVSTRGWIKCDGNEHTYSTIRGRASPLLLFLHFLTNAGGFPATLTGINLFEEFHTKINALFQFTSRAIMPCKGLMNLRVTFALDNVAFDTLVYRFGLRHYPKRHGLPDWGHLAGEEEVVIRAEDQNPAATFQGSDGPLGEVRIRNLAKTVDDIVAARESLWDTAIPPEPAARMRIFTMEFVRNTDLPQHQIAVYSGIGHRYSWYTNVVDEDIRKFRARV